MVVVVNPYHSFPMPGIRLTAMSETDARIASAMVDTDLRPSRGRDQRQHERNQPRAAMIKPGVHDGR